ncbi:MAG TPA: TraM recognition domain-containing protein [Candidatus Paceibacterota bacterium]
MESEHETTQSSEQLALQAELEALHKRAEELKVRLEAQSVKSVETSAPRAEQAAPSVETPRGLPSGAPEGKPLGVSAPHTESFAPHAHPEESVTLNLAPETHDEKMGELIGMMQEKGVVAAVKAAEATNDPHLIDDSQRVISEYVKEGKPAKSAPSEKSPLGKALGLTLLEVTLAGRGEKDEAQKDAASSVRDHIALMEQFYRSVLSLGENTFFAFEIANAAGAHTTSAYIAVPLSRKELFEKQITGLFPHARISERLDDYNIFAEHSFVAAARAEFLERPIFALRDPQTLPNDPLETLLTAFSKLDKAGEGAALQCVVWLSDKGLGSKYREALQKIREGADIRHATKIRTGFGEFFHELTSAMAGGHGQTSEKKTYAPDDPRIKAIERKTASPLVYVDVRIIASAGSEQRASDILMTLEAPLSQLSDTAGGNALVFKRVKARGDMKDLVHAFIYRTFDEKQAVPMNASELAMFAHIPRTQSSEVAPELKQEQSAASAAPLDLPQEGTLLGVNRFRNTATKAYLLPEDRLRHLYIIGQTGTGKSALLKNIVIQDIKAGNGVCFIDPHGSDVQDILSSIPPERVQDVIYFDPGDTARPMALNMLEYDPAHPEQKTLVVDELLGIFNKLFDMKVAGGPAFEQYFRNAALLVMEDPQSGNTLLDIARIFSDESFRLMKLARCKNPIVTRFWRDIASQATGDQGLQNYAPYVTNKFDVFTTNEIMRPIIAQQQSSFNFRDIMDNRKILLVNLAKGKIGDINANLLGLIIVGKFLLAALSRTDAHGDLPPFYLTIDEFQNVTTPSIATILSEARKYKLSLTVAHQFIKQLDENISNAVFGNVGSTIAFRVGADDAQVLEKQFAPTFSAGDLLRVDNYRAFVRPLVRGRPVQPFNIETLPFEKGTSENLQNLKELSALQYGRPREEIEHEIARMHG